jgi:ribosomal protein S18 acetylase RimI-like enzyme
MLKITYRAATQADFDFLWELHRVELRPYIEAIWGWDEAWQLEYFQAHFDPSNQRIIRFRDQEIGTIKVEKRENEIFLAYIVILSVYQGKGLGTAVIQELLDKAKQNELPVKLKVLKTNPARQLYERLGFIVTEEHDTHYWMSTSVDY